MIVFVKNICLLLLPAGVWLKITECRIFINIIFTRFITLVEFIHLSSGQIRNDVRLQLF